MTETRKKKRKRLIGGVGIINVAVGDNVIKSTTTRVCGVKILPKDVDDVREKLKSLGIDKDFFNNPIIQKMLEQNCDNENGRVDSVVNEWLMFYNRDILKVMKRIHNNTFDATEIFKLLTKNKNNVEQTISMIDTATSPLSLSSSSSLPAAAPLIDAPLPAAAPSSLQEAPASSSSSSLSPALSSSSSLPAAAPLKEAPPQEPGNPYFTKYDFSVEEFYNITKAQYTLKEAIALLKNPIGIGDPVTRKKVEIIRMVENGRDAINKFDNDPTIFKENGDEQLSGHWKVILKLNAFLSGIEEVTTEEARIIQDLYETPKEALTDLPQITRILRHQEYRTSLKQKLEYAFFLNPRIKNIKFKNIDELVLKINSTIQESKGISGGKHTRRRKRTHRRKLFRHKTRHAVNRL